MWIAADRRLMCTLAVLRVCCAGQDGPGVIIYHDISMRCLETANVLCDRMGIGRERVSSVFPIDVI
jgi:hypothetical protein